MQARYYDPVIGRFYSNDPVGFRDVHSFNRYAYANNNSYKYVDPFGMSPSYAEKFASSFCTNGCTRISGSGVEGGAVDAKYGQIPIDENGNPRNGSISCDISCQKAAGDWYKFTIDELNWSVMYHNYYAGQSIVADGLMKGALVAGGIAAISEGSIIIVGELAQLSGVQQSAVLGLTMEGMGLFLPQTVGFYPEAGYVYAAARAIVPRMRIRAVIPKPKIKVHP